MIVNTPMRNRATSKVLFLFLLISILSACKKSLPIDHSKLGWNSDSYKEFISDYSPHEISTKDNIILRLAKSSTLVKPVAGSTIDGDIVSLSPSAAGRWIWQDDLTLQFIPETRLESNTQYSVTLHLDNLYQDTKSKSITLTLATLPQKLYLSENGISYNYSTDGTESLEITGHINASDALEAKQIESLLVASQEGKNLPITWSHINDREHEFVISKIMRTDKDSHVLLSYDGKNIDANFSGNKKILIVKKGDFRYVDHNVSRDGNSYVELIFSDPLMPNQDLKGLININDSSYAVNYEIDYNKLRIYIDSKSNGEIRLKVDKHLKNNNGKILENSITEKFTLQPEMPEVMALRNGVIMPETDQVLYPFQAKNLKYVDVVITKIYQNNVLQFLQYHNINESYDLNAVGKEIVNKKITLQDISPVSNRLKWQRYTLDLSKLVNLDPGAIYNLQIKFNKEYYDYYPCNTPKEGEDASDEDYEGNGSPQDPCHYSYFWDNRLINTNILASNIGMIAKVDANFTTHIICTDIMTGEPINGADVEIYDFQKQILIQSKSSSQGFAQMPLKEKPSFAIVKYQGQYGYLNLQDNYGLSTSEFEVEGKKIKTGLDAMIYGERGVYRPGDSMHINVMIFNHNTAKSDLLPDNFPVKLTLTDSRGKIQYEKVNSSNKNHIYYFPISTSTSAPTGNWRLTAHLGNEQFTKQIKVETVKPNRLKINYAQDKKEILLFKNETLALSSQWLHGASADGLKAEVDLTIMPQEIKFPTYKSYTFEDPTRKPDYNTMRLYEGNLDGNGKAVFNIEKNTAIQPSSGIKTVIKTRVYEKSGGFSDDYLTLPGHAYDAYVGLKLPDSEWGGNYYKSNTNLPIKAVVLGNDGKPLANRKLTVGLYDAEWDWWYNNSNYEILKFNTGTHVGAEKTFELKTNLKGEAILNQSFDENQNYMIRICDDASGHCTGGFFYASEWGNPPSNSGAAQLINISTDKEKYNTGEFIKLRIPSNEDSKIIVSLETGSAVNQIMRLNGNAKETEVNIPVTKEMTPNVYLNVSVIQSYAKNKKALPLRMYGIASIQVNDPQKTLYPVINAPKIIEPSQAVSISVSEKTGKAMAYTLAIVDEGLLDLTRFKTPNPIDHFFAKQSLGVTTWDLYDKVMSKFGEEYENQISIGGDGESVNVASVKKANRFTPVVKYLGSHTLAANSTVKHNVAIHDYVGSVRIMVVAKSAQAFGNAESVMAVKKDLMVQTTLPRILAPGDEISLASNVFAYNGIKNVAIKLDHDPYITPIASSQDNLMFSKEGDLIHNFALKVNNQVGNTRIGSIVSAGKVNSKDYTEIEVRNPNPDRTEVKDFIIDASSTKDLSFDLFGVKGSNTAQLELSTSPIINLGSRLRYLIQYPYGCVEQTTSSAFPQLYVGSVSELSEPMKAKVARNITKAIQRLTTFQVSNGGFSYWQSNSEAEDWATSYVGHFLIEAKAKAHYVSEEVLSKWYTYQRNRAISFAGSDDWQIHAQAYRLYTLAKHKKPELGAMNKLRVMKIKSRQSYYSLASAYALAGKKDIAKELITKAKALPLQSVGENYYYNYGSDLRDQSMMAEASIEAGLTQDAYSIFKSIGSMLNTNKWYNTQAVSYALMVLQKYAIGDSKSTVKADLSYMGKSSSINSSKSVSINEIMLVDSKINQSIKVKNNSGVKLYARISYSGKDDLNKGLEAYQKHVKINVRYTDSQNKIVDISNLKQGTNFFAQIEVINLGTYSYNIQNMACDFIIPSGWEINNDRLAGIEKNEKNQIAYQDIRDDRVTSFFDIRANKSVQISIPLTATYLGKFYMPGISCKAMYIDEVTANTGSNHVRVTPFTSVEN